MTHPYNTLKSFDDGTEKALYHSLPALDEAVSHDISRLPVTIRILLESLLRNYDGDDVTKGHIEGLASWSPDDPGGSEVPFKVARILMQDLTGVPAVVDLAAMRSGMARFDEDPKEIQPSVPVDLVIDHSIQVDTFGVPEALERNTELEFERNEERYEFLKWGQESLDGFNVIPPGNGIVHQVNLEYIADVVVRSEHENGEPICYPDTLVGTDSHTPMINGLGVLAWGVGGIEAEAGLLEQPVIIPAPEVVGLQLTGSLRDGVTATDLVLTITEFLRERDVVGKFVEFFGEGVEQLSLPDRATLGNMTPEYGATTAYTPVDQETLDYMRLTGRSEEQIERVRQYFQAQDMFGIPKEGDINYSQEYKLDLSEVNPSIAGPKLPQERIPLGSMREKYREIFGKEESSEETDLDPDLSEPSTGESEVGGTKTTTKPRIENGDVVIAAITSCTNTSNPTVMVGAGLLAQNAVEKGLNVPEYIKTSTAPGSRVVTEYLEQSGLLDSLENLGFGVAAYGCTTCIGNSGPLPEYVEQQIDERDLVTASVLSGNRNFEARIHNKVRANFLMSPPLVVAYALAGNMKKDLTEEPLGTDKEGEPVYLRDIWPTQEEIRKTIREHVSPDMFKEEYKDIYGRSDRWEEMEASGGTLYEWDEDNTYIQEPPYFQGDFDLYEMPEETDIIDARPLLLLPDNTTTDHISPAGAIPEDTPAGQYLKELGVEPKDFNTYGARRGNDRVMTRGTFANVRINNLMVPGKEGGYTRYYPGGETTTVYEAAEKYKANDVPLIVMGGKNYGAGSSRDWAAKGTKLLGVRAVVATSYERIHRANLFCMGVLPLQFPNGENPESLGFKGDEVFSLTGLEDGIEPGGTTLLTWETPDGQNGEMELDIRLDTPAEMKYYRHRGVLDYAMRDIVQA